MWQMNFWNGRIQVVTGPSNGPTLLMLHGVSRRWQTFQPLLPALIPFFQVVLLDHRGHGKSRPTADGSYLVVDYIADAAAVARSLQHPLFIYGHSLGAMTAAGVAAAMPEQVRGLILEDPPFDTMGRGIFQTRLHSQFQGMQKLAGSAASVEEVAKRLAAVELVDPNGGPTIRMCDVRDAASLRFSAACLKNVDPHVFDSIVAGDWLNGYDRAAILKSIPCPTLLLQADVKNDGMWPDEEARKVESELSSAVRIPFPGAPHLLHGSRTQELANHVLGFLASMERSE